MKNFIEEEVKRLESMEEVLDDIAFLEERKSVLLEYKKLLPLCMVDNCKRNDERIKDLDVQIKEKKDQYKDFFFNFLFVKTTTDI